MNPAAQCLLLSNFLNLDTRRVRGRPMLSMDTALNTIAHRDGVARRRWALGYHPIYVDGSTVDLAQEPPNLMCVQEYTDGGTYDVDPLYQWGFKDCGDLLYYIDGNTPLNVLVSQGIKLRLFSGAGNYQTCATSGGDRIGWFYELTTYGWENFNAGPIEFELVDTSTPDAQGGYRDLIIANGRSVIQKWQGGNDTEPIALTGADPLTLEAIQRSRIVKRFKDTMLYVCDTFPNFIFYSRPLASGGFYEFDESGDAYFVHIDSGLDSPITNLVQFGDLMYVFTTKSIWRVQYGSFAVQWVMDVGCPSQQGVVMVGAVGAGAESVSGPGSMMYITNDRSIMVSDGMTSQDVSEPIRDILDALTDYQVRNTRAIKNLPLGIISFVWPSHDLTRTEGVVFDVHDNNWIGELRYENPTDSVGYVNGRPCLGMRDAGEVVKGYNAIAPDNRRYWVAGVAQMQTDYTSDFAWDYLYTDTVPAPDETHNIRGLGYPIRQEFRTPDMDFDNPMTIKSMSNLFFDLEPTGNWNIESLVFGDWKNQGVSASIPVIGQFVGTQTNIMEVLGDFALDSDIALPYDKLALRGQHQIPAHAHAIGLRHEPGRTAETINGTAYDVADPSGFNVRSIAIYVTPQESGGPKAGPVRTRETP